MLNPQMLLQVTLHGSSITDQTNDPPSLYGPETLPNDIHSALICVLQLPDTNVAKFEEELFEGSTENMEDIFMRIGHIYYKIVEKAEIIRSDFVGT